MRDLPDLQEKIREFPFSCIYSIKARALIHAHLLRLPLPLTTLQKDKNVIVKKCPFLINEMVNVVSNIIATVNSNGAPKSTESNIFKILNFLMQLFFIFRFSCTAFRNFGKHYEIVTYDCSSIVGQK